MTKQEIYLLVQQVVDEQFKGTECEFDFDFKKELTQGITEGYSKGGGHVSREEIAKDLRNAVKRIVASRVSKVLNSPW